MDRLREILSQRTPPGVILFNPRKRIRYINKEAQELIPTLAGNRLPHTSRRKVLPPEITDLLEKMAGEATPGDPFAEPVIYSSLIVSRWRIPLSLRGMIMGPAGTKKGANHFLVLVERIVEKRPVNVEGIKDRYHFTEREMEILSLVCNGLSNKAIAEKVFVSLHTVKGHLTHIMEKLGVQSRNQIVALLMNQAP